MDIHRTGTSFGSLVLWKYHKSNPCWDFSRAYWRKTNLWSWNPCFINYDFIDSCVSKPKFFERHHMSNNHRICSGKVLLTFNLSFIEYLHQYFPQKICLSLHPLSLSPIFFSLERSALYLIPWKKINLGVTAAPSIMISLQHYLLSPSWSV